MFFSVSQKQAPLLSAVFPNDAPILVRYPKTSLYQPLDYSSSAGGRQLNQCVRWFCGVLTGLAGRVI